MANYIRKDIQDIKAYTLSSYPEAIKLNQNEIPYDIPGELKAKVLEKLIHLPWNRYPLYQPFELRKQLAQSLAVDPEAVLISNGSNVLIQAILLATSLQSKVLTIDPTFSLYELEGKILGNEVVLCPLAEDFSFPEQAFLQKIAQEKPTAIFIANPNAPTANLFSKQSLLKVIESSPCIVVVDEAYAHFADENLLDELPKYKNLVLLRTFSKAFGLGGVRLGYAIGHPEVISEIAKVMLPYCVSGINEAVGLSLLEHPELVEKYVTEIKIERARMYQSMSNFSAMKVYPSQTNFLIFQVADAAKTFQDLLNEKILVRNVSIAQSLPNTLRVSVGTPEENDQFLGALQKVVQK